MPWDTVTLNSGHEIPTIAFGTWRIGNGDKPVENAKTALSVGFSHIDTAQAYRNEVEAGRALRESGLPRDKVFVTTKYSGLDGLGIRASIHNSLKNLGISYVDLYLIHAPFLAKPDIPTAWKEMEALVDAGLARSIGVSNFGAKDLEILLKHARILPAANQILFHPYVYKQQLPTLEICTQHRIVVEGYSPLIPLTQYPYGPVSGVVGAIATREGVKPEQVLLAWAKAKGAVVVTTSSRRWRLEGYIAAGDLALTTSDLVDIDEAGGKGAEPPAVPVASEKLSLSEKAGAVVDVCALEEGAPVRRRCHCGRSRKARKAFVHVLVFAVVMGLLYWGGVLPKY
jgi:diketogulonate reductase-like aldo/keto reductase